MNKRKNNLDLLRIICCLLVVVIHVCTLYKEAILDKDAFDCGLINDRDMYFTLILDSFARFSTPCFFMLSGYLTLSNPKNLDYKYFYKKSFNKIFLTTFIFYVIDIMFSYLKPFIRMAFGRPYSFDLTQPIENALKGVPYYHMWFLSVLVVMYLLVPFIIRLKEKMGKTKYLCFSIVYLVVAVFVGLNVSFKSYFDPICILCYLAIFNIGYILGNYDSKKHKPTIYFLLGFIGLAILSYIQIRHYQAGIGEENEVYSLISLFNPLLLIPSLFIFKGFLYVDIDKDLRKEADLTYQIYLWHALVLYILNQPIIKYGYYLNNILVMCIEFIAIILISCLLGKLYNKIFERIVNRSKIAR